MMSAMKKARALVGMFNSSNQAADMLLRVQEEANVKGAVGVKEDVVTQWWSTYTFREQLWRLREHCNTLFESSAIHHFYRLSEEQWLTIYQIMKVLEPFRVIQQMFEGQKYVTLSMVPYCIDALRRDL